MPFNKGDFTQQGVAGHVNAILRLNEKRYVGIDLTSDENDEGCTISGAVYDLLNEEVYPIGAGVSGNIEITENGENINVAPYATATVNVSGNTIPKCAVTVINDREDIIRILTLNDSGILEAVPIAVNDTETVNCLYAVSPLDQKTVVTLGSPGDFMLSSNAFTDITNLTVKEFLGSYYVEVTDPTTDSACTIHASDLD